MKIFLKSHIERWALAYILSVAAILRLVQLGKRDFWVDEAFTGIAIRESWSGMMTILTHDVHPPLYYFGAKLLSSAFSYSIIGIRLYSVVFGILCVYMVYLIARELYGTRAGKIAALISAIAPFAIQYSQEARMYTQYAFCILVAIYFLSRSCNSPRKIYPILWGLALGLGILTQYIALIFVPIFVLIILIWKKEGSYQPGTRIRNIVIGLAVMSVIIAPWTSHAIDQYKRMEDGFSWTTIPQVADIMNTATSFILGAAPGGLSQGQIAPAYHLQGVNKNVTGIAVLALILLAGGMLLRHKRHKAIPILLLIILPPATLYVLSHGDHSYYVSRYLIPVSFSLYILLGAWIAGLKPRLAYIAIVVYLAGIALTARLPVETAWNAFAHANTGQKNYYALNPFDYVIAKYYVGADHLTLFNVDNPNERPVWWAAIGESLVSTSNPHDLVTRPDPVITFLPLHISQKVPTSLSSVEFDIIDSFGTLYLVRPRASNE